MTARRPPALGQFLQQTMPPMLFSIITVTYNAESTVEPTLRSVASQRFDDYEHIVIDGASTDHTLDLCRKYDRPQLIVNSEPDSGIYDAMNRGLRKAKGDYVIFLNAGDTFHSPDTLREYASAAGEADIIYGQTQLVRGASARIPAGMRHLTAPAVLNAGSFCNGMLVCHQSMAVRRSIAPDYDLRYRLSADFDWAIRCLQASRRNVYIDDIVTDYLDEGATTRNHRRSLQERFRIMCRYYGTLPTLLRHVRFLGRSVARKFSK